MDQLTTGVAPAARRAPADIAAKLAGMGTALEAVREPTWALYQPLLQQIAWPTITVHRDLAYGPDRVRNLLDVHVPAEVPAGAPVVAYFHGGGMIAGAKVDDSGLVYGNVANTFASHGMIGVNATYRLAPAHPYPAGGEDVGAAVAWLTANAAKFGGDPKRIFIMGHSAGAAHVATYAFQSFLHPAGGPGIAGAILVSGTYGLDATNPPPNRVAYYGDPAGWAKRQVLGNVARADFPVFIVVAEYDLVATARTGFELAAEIALRHKRQARFKQVLDHNHFSEIYALGTGDPSLGPDLIDFIEGVR
jgi:triacylglycerol lipase